MLYLTIASLIVALIAAGYAVKQTSIAKAMQDKQDDEQKEVRDWQARHEAVARQLCKINPLFQAQYPDGIVRVIYADLFPANPVRIAIETTIIRRDQTGSIFIPLAPTPHELRSAFLRETIKTVEARLARFREENPTVADIFKG